VRCFGSYQTRKPEPIAAQVDDAKIAQSPRAFTEFEQNRGSSLFALPVVRVDTLHVDVDQRGAIGKQFREASS